MLCSRHDVCKKKLYGGKCYKCDVKPDATNTYADYLFKLIVQDWDDPFLTHELAASTPGGTSLFNAKPDVFSMRSEAAQDAAANRLAMKPFKVRLSVTWNMDMKEVSILAFQFWPIDVEGGSVKRSKTNQVNLGLAS